MRVQPTVPNSDSEGVNKCARRCVGVSEVTLLIEINGSERPTRMKLEKVLFVTPYVGIDTPQSMPFVKLLVKVISDEGIKTEHLLITKTANPFKIHSQVKSLREMTKIFNPQIVVANYGTYTGLLVAVFGRHPKVIIFRGTDLNPDYSSVSTVHRIAMLTASHIASFLVDGMICVSRELYERLWHKSKPVTIIPDPTNLDLFRTLDREDCRVKLGWNTDKPIAVFFSHGGRKEKRPDLAEIIRSRIQASDPHVELKIIFQASLSEMPVYLNAADCLLFLSETEGSPNLIREACACNLPIVTVPVGDVAEVLEHVHPSRIVARDIEALTAETVRISRLRVRSNGREHILKYGTKIVARKHIEFYESLIKE